MNDIYNIIKGPCITEKSASLGSDKNKIVLWVDNRANKYEIKEAVEKLFGVKVEGINTQRLPGKARRFGRYSGRTPIKKKAYVTLAPGESLAEMAGKAQA